MRSAPRSLAALLLAVMLVTVLAPSFGWEIAVGQGAHGHDRVAFDGAADSHAGHDGNHRDDEDSRHHHDCAGHMLSHLVAHCGNATAFTTLDLDSGVSLEPHAAIPRGFPERLDRPPIAPLLA